MRHTALTSWIGVAAIVLAFVGQPWPARADDAVGQPANQSPAQVPAQPAPVAVNPPANSGDKPPLKQEELDQLIAPIALYPDSLVSQILMASTYPLEVVEADRWSKQNSTLKGDALAKALESQTWDPSVKSLVNFPQVLTMMSDKLDMTVKLGDAFLGQQQQVMATVQKLRGKAQQTGNLKTTPEQTVKVEQQGSTQTIIIEPANPEVIYVPTYNPTVVYGTWPYPAYPPYYYYPPGYTAGAVALSFGVGVATGLAWGYAWGHCNWRGGDVDININQNNNFNRNIDRSKYQNNFNRGQGGKWQHDPSHRQGVAYRNQAATQKFGGQRSTQAIQSREAYRGRADAGRANLSRDTANMPSRNAGAGAGNRPATADRGAANRGAGTGTANRSQPARSGNSSAFDGVNRGGGEARQSSNRGSASRGYSGGGRSYSGGARGGGGRGGGGRGGGRR